eukprot:362623-Chlamydomonas_euryale.AAC.1
MLPGRRLPSGRRGLARLPTSPSLPAATPMVEGVLPLPAIAAGVPCCDDNAWLAMMPGSTSQSAWRRPSRMSALSWLRSAGVAAGRSGHKPAAAAAAGLDAAFSTSAPRESLLQRPPADAAAAARPSTGTTAGDAEPPHVAGCAAVADACGYAPCRAPAASATTCAAAMPAAAPLSVPCPPRDAAAAPLSVPCPPRDAAAVPLSGPCPPRGAAASTSRVDAHGLAAPGCVAARAPLRRNGDAAASPRLPAAPATSPKGRPSVAAAKPPIDVATLVSRANTVASTLASLVWREPPWELPPPDNPPNPPIDVAASASRM